MSTKHTLLSLLMLLAACRPAFEAIEPTQCQRPQPTPTCGPGCRLLRLEPGSQAKRLNDAPLALTGAVSVNGWTPVTPSSGVGPSVGVTHPLTVHRLLGASGDEVLFSSGPLLVALDAEAGAVSQLANTTQLPFQWAYGPSGGFFVVSGRLVSPSAPRHGARAVRLPAAPALVIDPARAPLPTDPVSGRLFIPTSSGLFALQPSAANDLSLLSAGTFTSAAVLGGDLYASRCEPMARSDLEGTAVVGPLARCEVLRAPLGSVEFRRIALLDGVQELMPRGDGLLVRSTFELVSLSRDGAKVVLYSLPRQSAPEPNQRLGALEPTAATAAFQLGSCLVTLDPEKGTVIGERRDPLSLELGTVSVRAVKSE